ncbi:MAG TPA: PspC domain-containing protein [candidate division Zixibacteria bacterium]|nr:PspC domain-containing protein [candidate division Zixibacteria bacterium]
MKKLYRSRNDCRWAGVLGGLGEYFAVDPTLVRLAYIIFTLTTGFFPGLVGYFLAILIIPKEPLMVSSPSTGAASPPAVAG